MHKIKSRTAPSQFFEEFEQPSRSCSARFSSWNYRKPQVKLRKCRFRISIRGPAIKEKPSQKVGEKKFNRLLFLKLR